MKESANHPHYKPAHITCACGAAHNTFSTRGDFGVDICSNCHGQAEADGHGRPHRPVQQEVREEGLTVLRQAVQ